MKTLNDVDEASRESFPASDAPAAGGMTRTGAPARNLPSPRRETIFAWWGSGIRAGVLGFVAIAVSFAAVDISTGQSPLYTAALLGSALIYGTSDPALVRVAFAPVLAYTVAHVVVFVALGLAGAWLAAGTERRRRRWFVALFVLVLVGLHLTAAVQSLAAPMKALLPAAAIWVSGLAAGALMAGYLVWSRRS